jgi:hypothetical protein
LPRARATWPMWSPRCGWSRRRLENDTFTQETEGPKMFLSILVYSSTSNSSQTTVQENPNLVKFL